MELLTRRHSAIKEMTVVLFVLFFPQDFILSIFLSSTVYFFCLLFFRFGCLKNKTNKQHRRGVGNAVVYDGDDKVGDCCWSVGARRPPSSTTGVQMTESFHSTMIRAVRGIINGYGSLSTSPPSTIYFVCLPSV